MMIDRKDLEYTVIGTILSNSDALKPIQRSLKPKDFSVQECSILYEIFLSLSEREINISLLTVSKEISDRNLKLFEESETNLSDYLDYDVGTTAVIGLATQLAEEATLNLVVRKIRNEFLPQVENKGYQLTSAIEQLSGIIKDANYFGSNNTLSFGEDLTEQVKLYKSRISSDIVLFGIQKLDEKIITLAPSETLIIAGRPGGGKSALAVQGAISNVLLGKKVGFISMEMPIAQIVIRSLSYLASFDSFKLQTMSFDEIFNSPHFKKYLNIITNGNLVVDDSPPFTIQSVVRKIREMVYTHNVNYVILDYVQLMDAKAENRNMALTEISRQIKLLAKELSIPIVMLAQLSRAVTQRLSAEPDLSDLRESGALEQDASLVAFIYPDLKGKEFSSDEDEERYLKTQLEVPVILKIAKQRNGPADFKEYLIFKKQFGQFVLKDKHNSTYIQ